MPAVCEEELQGSGGQGEVVACGATMALARPDEARGAEQVEEMMLGTGEGWETKLLKRTLQRQASGRWAHGQRNADNSTAQGAHACILGL